MAEFISHMLASMSRAGLFCLFLGLSAACVPATVPPQLAYTPGPPVRVMDGVVDLGAFQVEAPPGWRIVTSAASADPRVILVSPANTALIVVGEAATNVPELSGAEGPLRTEQQILRLSDEAQVTAVLHAPAADWNAHQAVFQSVLNSLASRSNTGPAGAANPKLPESDPTGTPDQ
jgi:hypothetical protein